eukprot:8012852-Lingulodinium_polyedra.AAC.1
MRRANNPGPLQPWDSAPAQPYVCHKTAHGRSHCTRPTSFCRRYSPGRRYPHVAPVLSLDYRGRER